MIQLPLDIELMNGRGEPTVFHIRRATPDDVDYVMQLQDTIMEALPNKDIYATYSREDSLDALETDYCYIAFADNGELAGYSVLIANTTPTKEKNYGHYFDYTDEQLAKTCSLDLTMVTPKWRGHGLQRLFNKPSIDTQQLFLICQALGTDLFMLYSDALHTRQILSPDSI